MDYTNAFAKAEINEHIYIEPPSGFVGADTIPKLLKLLWILYGLKQAPKPFFDKLKAGLYERDFVELEIDKCIFMKGDSICLVYVDDTSIEGPNIKNINRNSWAWCNY